MRKRKGFTLIELLVRLAVQSSLLRADGNGPSAIADFQGLDLKGVRSASSARVRSGGWTKPWKHPDIGDVQQRIRWGFIAKLLLESHA